jgi:hypothetical protein
VQNLKARIVALEAEMAALAALELDILKPILAQRSEDALAWLCSNALGPKHVPLKVKTSIARATAERGENGATLLAKALAKAKEAEEIFVLLDGLCACGDAAKPATAVVATHLGNKDATLREKVAIALATLAMPAAIEPLIKALEVEADAHTRRKLAIALEMITHQSFGETAASWRNWWKTDGSSAVAGGARLGGGTSKLASALSSSNGSKNYYGIPVDGKSIVYVIDCSGSMVASATHPKFDEKRNAIDAGKESRMEATKAALVTVLGKLAPKDKFAIIGFNDLVHPYENGLRVATPLEIDNARDWVQKLGAQNSTNIFDALQEAFRLAGRGSFDKYYESGVDTIFLLTDGAPTTLDGQPDSTLRVIEGVRQWNAAKRVILHTIGIGKEINADFLRKLANENGGTFVQQ